MPRGRAQGWAAEERAGREGRLRLALGDFQTLPRGSQTVPTPGVRPPACLLVNQSSEAQLQKEGQSKLGENHGFRALKAAGLQAGSGCGVGGGGAVRFWHSWVGAGCPGRPGPRSPSLWCGVATAGSPGSSLPSFVPPPGLCLQRCPRAQQNSCRRRGVGQAGRKGFLVEEGFRWALKNE